MSCLLFEINHSQWAEIASKICLTGTRSAISLSFLIWQMFHILPVAIPEPKLMYADYLETLPQRPMTCIWLSNWPLYNSESRTDMHQTIFLERDLPISFTPTEAVEPAIAVRKNTCTFFSFLLYRSLLFKMYVALQYHFYCRPWLFVSHLFSNWRLSVKNGPLLWNHWSNFIIFWFFLSLCSALKLSKMH